MDNRFSFKDIVLVALLVVVMTMLAFVGWQLSYQEGRINEQMRQFDQTQKQQLNVLSDINAAIRNGGGIAATVETRNATKPGRIRRKNPDGSIYVFYPDVPSSPRHPETRPDYATGDWLVQNVGMEPEKLTPFITSDMGASIIQAPVLESLVGLNPETMEFEPTVADSYEISADGMHFKFHIRPKVMFSDGVPMTADDVVFTYNTIMNPDVDAAHLKSYYDKVKSCKKVDEQTVEFEMSEPYFLAMEFIGGLSIIPQHIYKFEKGDDYNKRSDMLVGSGAYRLEKWDRGQKITLARNEKYWGDRPTYDRVVYLFIGNPQAQLQSFLTGQLDYMGEPIAPDPEQYIHYSKDPEFTKKFIAYKYSRPSGMYLYIGYNLNHPMFKDKETRKALTMLIDRKEIIDKMLLGFGAEMTGPFSMKSAQNDGTIKPLPYDMEAAKKLLAGAGWKTGADGVLARDGQRFEFNMSMRTGVPIRERLATYVQQQFQQAGIRMRLTPYESAVLLDKLRNRDFDACLAGWGGGGVESDPKQIWHSDSIKDRGSNHVSFSNKEADRFIEEARMTLDRDKRMNLWHEFQKIVYDEQPYTWLYSEQDCAFINGRFKNTEPYPLGLAELDWYVPAANQKYR